MEEMVYVSIKDIQRYIRQGRTIRALAELIHLAENKPKKVFGYDCRIPIKILIPDKEA